MMIICNTFFMTAVHELNMKSMLLTMISYIDYKGWEILADLLSNNNFIWYFSCYLKFVIRIICYISMNYASMCFYP